MRLLYEYKGPSSVSRFGHYVDGIRERKYGNLEKAVEDPQANFFIHVCISEMVVRSRFGLPGTSFGFGPPAHFSIGSYLGLYVVEATKAVSLPRLLRPLFGETRTVHLGVEGERLYPHKHAGISRPRHYAEFIVGIANEIMQKGKEVQIYAYDETEENITDHHIKAAVDAWVEAHK